MSVAIEQNSDAENLKEHIRNAWDRGAQGYDDQYGHGLKSDQEREAWRLLLRRLVPPEPRLKILDVGTGTGFLAVFLAELGHDVTGIDISEHMLSFGRQKALRQRLEVNFQSGDADAPPFPEATFDVVLSRHVLWTMLEPERAIRAWARVTRPGGQVMAIDGLWHPQALLAEAQIRFGRALREIMDPYRQRRHGGYSARVQQNLPLMGLRTLDPSRNAFERAGLEHVRAEELTWLDAVERIAMPLHEKLRNQYVRYLVEGAVPNPPGRGCGDQQ